MNTEYLLTIDEAATILRVHRSYIYKLIHAGTLPAPIKLGRVTRFKASELDEAVRAFRP
ncbi:AlpA Predicted transcriptional regulator [Sphingomonadaceae bacterium]